MCDLFGNWWWAPQKAKGETSHNAHLHLNTLSVHTPPVWPVLYIRKGVSAILHLDLTFSFPEMVVLSQEWDTGTGQAYGWHPACEVENSSYTLLSQWLWVWLPGPLQYPVLSSGHAAVSGDGRSPKEGWTPSYTVKDKYKIPLLWNTQNWWIQRMSWWPQWTEFICRVMEMLWNLMSVVAV